MAVALSKIGLKHVFKSTHTYSGKDLNGDIPVSLRQFSFHALNLAFHPCMISDFGISETLQRISPKFTLYIASESQIDLLTDSTHLSGS